MSWEDVHYYEKPEWFLNNGKCCNNTNLLLTANYPESTRGFFVTSSRGTVYSQPA